MTNEEIIIQEAILNNIYTQEQVEEMLSAGQSLQIHTFAVWKALGYSVKRGQHAKICTRLWKCKYKDVEMKDSHGNEITQNTKNMYMVKAYLFTRDQVEPTGA